MNVKIIMLKYFCKKNNKEAPALEGEYNLI